MQGGVAGRSQKAAPITMWTPEPREICWSPRGSRPMPMAVGSMIVPPPAILNFTISYRAKTQNALSPLGRTLFFNFLYIHLKSNEPNKSYLLMFSLN